MEGFRDSLMLEDFGQKVDLTRRIREVLVNYPEGTTVLKELIQNADDAGARTVRLCLDRRVHGVDSLLSDKLAEWQGPALLAYNDAEFTEDDFVSISRIGGSKKQGQAWKTGRFGVGFNSVYHLTDLPSFVSGKYAVLFDPQGVYLPNISAANPGKRLEYVSSSAISFYKDQFLPYCAFGCDMRQPFHGTLFRFPLRNADQAAVSKLSRQAFSEDDIASMFEQLYKEAVFTILFLKSVLSVEMFIWDVGTHEPRKLYSCSVRSPDDDTIWHRQALLRFSNSVGSSSSQIDSFSLDFLSESSCGAHLDKRVDTFFIVQAMASPSSRIGNFAAAAAKEHDIHLLPWASVAACISDGLAEGEVFKQGLAFCFLPLPLRTGLTVHVNGYFELSSNRRSIWYGSDMDRGGKLRSNWNTLLLEDVVSLTYNELLVGVRKLLGPTKLYYSLWPCGSFAEPWSFLVRKFYENIGNIPVLYSDYEGGKWVSPAEAFIHDEEFVKSTELGEALVLLGMAIVHLPNHLCDMLFKYAARFHQRMVGPGKVRNFLRECEGLKTLNRDCKLVLLEYCLHDLLDSDVGKHANGLPLVPLASGEFGLFAGVSKGSSYFICNELEYMLVSQIPESVIDRSIPPDIFSRLSGIGQSSSSNIAVFNVGSLLQFFPRLVPADWKYKDRVVWNPESYPNHPMTLWFVFFWQYLRDQCDELSRFHEWPILPSTSGHLHRASKTSKLIDAELLSSRIKDLLVNIGCKILNPIYGVCHRQLSLYIHDGTGAGVLDAIFHAISSSNEDHLQRFFQNFGVDEKNELCQFLLDPKWYIGGNITESHIQICKKLPIFRVYHNGASTVSCMFSDLKTSQKYLPPPDAPDYFLDVEFIYSLSNSEEEILSRYYGIERMAKTLFYRKKVLNKISELQPEFRDAVMLSILQDLPQLSLQDASMREILRKLEFVPTINGTLKCPQVLYDPRNEELYTLLENSDCFPCGKFRESSVLDMLQGLGLKTIVSPETILQSSRQVELMINTDPLRAHSQGRALLSYLEVNASKWLPNNPLNNGQRTMKRIFSKIKSSDMLPENDLEKFWNDLRVISWCPVLVSPSYPLLPWPSVSSMVAPPKLVRLQADMWLVSASMRILDGECSSTALSISLGWSSPPSGSIIAAQLLELGKNNELVSDQVLRQELALVMPRIYSVLTGMLGSDEMDIVKAVLEGCCWIWVGDGFAKSDEVVLHGHLHLVPYIRVIPIDLAVFRELFLELGVREFLNPMDYASITCRMALKKDGAPLDTQELRAAVLILHHLADAQYLDRQQVQIYLPDVSSRLLPAENLVYDDAPWLLNSGDGISTSISFNAKRNNQKFVHGNISNVVSEKLGVCSLRRLLLAESADSMNLSLSEVGEAFGQHEALTTRLRHIVEMYADGPGILFELVQNADDAGASEVTFLLDKTQYGNSSVLSPEMADWQGCALYCFNDSVFSPQDLNAISRIGQDSKLEKPFAIGRFGLGFNCVYHFTDIPGFVSGENIVMFDPHACHLPGISPSQPGLRIQFVGRRILEQFPDQFSPFLQFGCDLKNPFPGTLFRFPLRNESSASRSQIKKEKYAPEDVLSLFSSFSEVVSEALLFLRNVTTISLFMKDGAGHEMQLLHRVSKHQIRESESGPHPMHVMLDFIHGNMQNGMDKEEFFKKLSRTVDSDLPWSCRKIVVKEKNTLGDNMSHFWMVSECLGGGNARAKSVAFDNRSHNFIPWACVAAYLHSINVKEPDQEIADNSQNFSDSVQHRRDFNGRAFCFLPLPITTSLPTHVNSYFELSSNRRDIWFGNDMAGGGKVRSDWNISLLEDAIAPAYVRLLEKVAAEIGPCDLYFSFWPTTIGHEPWASMVRKLYICIAELGLSVLYTKARGGQWVSTKHAVFPDFSFPEANELTEALSEAGLPLVVASKLLVERFKELCPLLHFLTPQLLRTLLIRRKRGFKNRDAMILTLKYCLSDISGSVPYHNLYGLPLLPLANTLFTAFNKHGEGERIFITGQNEYGLLKDSVPNLLVDCTIPEEILTKLHDIAQSGCLNISLLTCHSLEDLFPRFLPSEWVHAKEVIWSPSLQGQPSLEWMGLLWSYLKSSCVDLSIFDKWPILPVKSGHLLQLVRNSNVIKDDGWSENMSSLLQKLGFSFLRSDLPIDHPQLKDFVHNATAPGILNALLAVAGEGQNVKELFSQASEGEMRELRSFIFQSKWFCGEYQMDSLQIEMIKLLPIFESYKNRKFVSLDKPAKWLSPEGVHEDLMDENFIITESDREKTILKRFLGIREPSRAEFYRDHVLNRIADLLSQPSILSAILLDIKLLIEEDISIKMVLSQTPFVLTVSGSWQHPSRLYDPRIPGLQQLLHKEAFFPCGEFLNTGTLETLVSLGLKTTFSFTALLDGARTVFMLHESGNEDVLNYGRRLLICLDGLAYKLASQTGKDKNELSHSTFLHQSGDFCDEYAEFKFLADASETGHGAVLDMQSWFDDMVHDIPEEEFWLELRSIAWCPVLVDSPLQGLPWFLSKDRVASPRIVRPKSQMWMVSSTMRILDGDCNSQYLQNKLGWSEHPNASILSTQLVEISKSYCQIKSQSQSQGLLDVEIPRLYSRLQEFVGTDDFEIIKSALDGIPWVWVGDDFVSPKSLTFDSPVKFNPYLYVVPSELSEFRVLLSNLGVRLNFDAVDYVRVLQTLQQDTKELPLSTEQLGFVHRVLEAVAECSGEKPLSDVILTSVVIPDSSGVLMYAMDLVYDDAPWMEKNTRDVKHFVHSSISNDLANRLGVQSLRYMSLVNEEMTKDLPCMDYGRICELLALYGNNDFLLFDLLELADCCKAKKLHVIFDKREHPGQSLLQHNLGEFQGPALLVVLEGATMSMEEVCNLQFLPPWKLRGTTLNYGLGLLSCYWICDLPSIVSNGFLYMFDPCGLALAASPSSVPAAKMYSLIGTNLTERFRDQFHPMIINEGDIWPPSDSTIIRMPLSSRCIGEGLESGSRRVKHIFDRYMEHASKTLLFLKSVLKVSLSTWEEGKLHPCQDFSVFVDPSCAIKRNPFSEKGRKSLISMLLSNSSVETKLYTIDTHIFEGDSEVTDKWLVVLSLGSGQTKNMARQSKYHAYYLTPVAGVAAHISRNGKPAGTHPSCCILSPLPLSGDLSLPVTTLGYFLVCHNSGRYLFNYENHDAGNKLIADWNKELMSCVCDSYVKLVLEFSRLRNHPPTSALDSNSAHAVSLVSRAYGDQIYSFWPRSSKGSKPTKAFEADWQCLVEQVIRPFYVKLVDQQVWQLYRGELAKAKEGMFLSQPGLGSSDNSPPTAVYSFIREHYPVFSVPWDLVREIQAVGIEVREIKPKMVRDLLKASYTSVVLPSVETYIDVLEYCLYDINSNRGAIGAQFGPDHLNQRGLNEAITMDRNMAGSGSGHLVTHNSVGSGGDALEMVTSFGKALFDFGRGVVEDIGRAGAPSEVPSTSSARDVNRHLLSVVSELKGLPCPTATKHLARLGITELWVGSKEQQLMMLPLAAKFIHPQCLERSILSDFFSNQIVHRFLKLQNFSFNLLSSHLRLIFSKQWVNYVMDLNKSPCIPWENNVGGPSSEWIRLFWKIFNGSSGELSLFSDWPLIPAFQGGPVLCRVKDYHMVFIPPITQPALADAAPKQSIEQCEMIGFSGNHLSEPELMLSYFFALEMTKSRYPWLLPLLNQSNIPVYDMSFLDCGAPRNCFPRPDQSLGQVIISKILAAKHAGYFSEPSSFPDAVCDELFTLFASDFTSPSQDSAYKREELDLLRALPIYRTVVGTYTRLLDQDLCIISPSAFFQPQDTRCLSNSIESSGTLFFHALGVPEFHDIEILVKFALPGYAGKSELDQECILTHVYKNWEDLQMNSTVISAMKETNFVRSSNEFCVELFKPKDVFDPCDSLLRSVFSEERSKFPGERFTTDGWLRILRKVGLRTSSEADVIIECAKKVETLGGEALKNIEDPDAFDADVSNFGIEISHELWALAGSVVEAILANFPVLYGNDFCNLISRIAFVPSEKGLPSIEGKTGGKRILCSYSEAILLRDWPLAWSCSPILTRKTMVPPEFSWGAFHLRSPPAFSTVLKHLQIVGRNGGVDTLAHWPTSSGMMSIEGASCEVLKYLDRIWGSLSTLDISELQRVAFIPVANGTRLVTANSLFVHLAVNLSPFAFELPTLYLPFVKILKEIGLQELLSVTCATDILINIQKSCGYQRLNPNELRAVMEILQFIYDGMVQTRLDRFDYLPEAIVPDDGCRLVHARSCVYVDTYGSKFIGNIDISRIRFVHPELSEKICMGLGVKKLSDMVIEELDHEQELQVLDGIGSISLKMIRDKLTSRSFQTAAWMVINSISYHMPEFEDISLEQIECLFRSVADKLQFVRLLYTRYLLLPNSLDITRVTKETVFPEWENRSGKHRSVYFINRSKTQVLVAEPPGFISIFEVITIVMSQILNSPIILPIGPLFSIPENSEKESFNILNLGSQEKRIRHGRGREELLGQELLQQDALQVQFHPLRPFYAGELVAWRTEKEGEKLKYGRVPENVRPSAGQALYRFMVETAPGESQQLLSSRVFSFRSIWMENGISSSVLHDEIQARVQDKNQDQGLKGVGSGKLSSTVQIKELHYGRVSPTELVQAVRDMLSAAGIPIDVEKQTLLQTTLTLQEQLRENQAALLLEQEKADAATKEAEVAKTAWSCRVCLSSEVEVTIVPCGHVLCIRCSAAVARCPFCRLKVAKTLKIFRP